MKMKPVFSDKERDIERDLDVTTVSKETPISNMVNMVTKEEAESIARQYADQASEQAVNTALEKYDNRRREEDDRRRKEMEAERGAEIEAKKRRRKEDEDDGEDSSISVINPKVVKQLKDTVSIFTALKELSSNPLQKTIEETVGGMAAGVVQKAFTPQHPEQKKDILDIFLNSQFAYGFGSGMGQRAPELVETFGREKVDGWITGAIKGGGGGTGVMGGIGSVIGGGMPGTQLPPPVQEKQQSEVEMILGLDPNNPEHVAAYAKSQGDITVGTARKILMIHQDDFISQLESKGVDATPYKLRRGQSQSQSQSQNQDMPSQNQDLTSIPESGNVQEYRRPPPRINEDLIVNTPVTEDKRWENENDKSDSYVNNLETQNVDLHPQMERAEKRVEKVPLTGDSEIMTYLKNLTEQQKLSNEHVIGLKDMVERQQQQQNAVNNDLFNLRQELDVIKKGDRPEILEVEGRDDNQTTTVRSIKTIKKGFAHVRTD